MKGDIDRMTRQNQAFFSEKTDERAGKDKYILPQQQPQACGKVCLKKRIGCHPDIRFKKTNYLKTNLLKQIKNILST